MSTELKKLAMDRRLGDPKLVYPLASVLREIGVEIDPKTPDSKPVGVRLGVVREVLGVTPEAASPEPSADSDQAELFDDGNKPEPEETS